MNHPQVNYLGEQLLRHLLMFYVLKLNFYRWNVKLVTDLINSCRVLRKPLKLNWFFRNLAALSWIIFTWLIWTKLLIFSKENQRKSWWCFQEPSRYSFFSVIFKMADSQIHSNQHNLIICWSSSSSERRRNSRIISIESLL